VGENQRGDVLLKKEEDELEPLKSSLREVEGDIL